MIRHTQPRRRQACVICDASPKRVHDTPAEIWNETVPKKYHGRLICDTCLANLIAEKFHTPQALYRIGPPPTGNDAA